MERSPKEMRDERAADDQTSRLRSVHPYRVLTFSSVAALVLAALGSALLPYVFIGMLGILLSFVALILAFRTALSVLQPQGDGGESGDGGGYSILLLIGGVLVTLVATGELGLAVPHILRPEDFRSDGSLIGLWGFLALVGPSMVTAGVRNETGMDDSRMTAVWLYWFSYVPAAMTTSFLISLLGWGGRT